MNDQIRTEKSISKLGTEKLPLPRKRRGPGRGIGQKRIVQERLETLDTIFDNIQEMYNFLSQQGHMIINESGSMLASQSHQNLDQLLKLLEDFLWVINCAIAKNGGQAKLP